MNRLRIINFHGIGTPKRTLDPGEPPFWVSRDQFLRILDRVAAHSALPNFKLTFDDGNTSDLELAAPALAERGLTGTFFVLTGRLDGVGSLDAGDLRALAALG